MDKIKLQDPQGELERVYYLKPFEKELLSIFGKSKAEYKSYMKYLIKCLNVLDKTSEHLSAEPFEHLEVDGYDIYRIKSKSKKNNIRVIYFYTQKENIVLLCAFQEKNESDYHNNIKKAKSRIDSLSEE